MNPHNVDSDFKSSHDVMRASSPLEQLHIMSGPSSGRSSLELPDQEGMSNVYPHWRSHDPRNSSSQSLAPTLGDSNGRRTLLVVYLHGFMGNDSSFRSFPAHVHSYLKEALEETHVVHTKIYPRYKTYKSVDVARDNFSKWLEPHESYTTDIVLVGHSMGGLLAADVVLMPGSHGNQFEHRILGTISLDSPFLGLHPGIIVSGIASLFRPADKPPTEGNCPSPQPLSPNASNAASPGLSQQSSFSQSALLPGDSGATTPSWVSHAGAGPSDPYFNPPFVNDVQFKDRGFLNNVIHFTKKHMDENLVSAAKNHIMAHLEFGSCLADYPGLNQRYSRIRQLEDVDVWKGRENPGYVEPTRVRFVNYFTISTGRVSKPKSPGPSPGLEASTASALTSTASSTTHASQQEPSETKSGPLTPRISIENPDGGQPKILELSSPIPEKISDQPPAYSLEHPSATATPTPITTSTDPTSPAPADVKTSTPTQTTDPYADLNLPAIPDLPSPPTPLDLSQYPDPTARKQAEKEYKSALKTYDQAVKSRDKVLADRTKLIEKSKSKAEKDAAKEAAKLAKEAAKKEAQAAKDQAKREQAALKDQQKKAKEEAKRLAKQSSELEKQASKDEAEKKKKERKFCMLPRKTNGERDSAWVEVYMEGVDEVGAHCGLFFPGPHYEKLVGDVGARIVGWVQEDASRRAIEEMETGLESIQMVDLDLD